MNEEKFDGVFESYLNFMATEFGLDFTETEEGEADALEVVKTYLCFPNVTQEFRAALHNAQASRLVLMLGLYTDLSSLNAAERQAYERRARQCEHAYLDARKVVVERVLPHLTAAQRDFVQSEYIGEIPAPESGGAS